MKQDVTLTKKNPCSCIWIVASIKKNPLMTHHLSYDLVSNENTKNKLCSNIGMALVLVTIDTLTKFVPKMENAVWKKGH